MGGGAPPPCVNANGRDPKVAPAHAPEIEKRDYGFFFVSIAFIDVSFFVESIFMPVSAFIAELSLMAGAACFIAAPVSAAGFACEHRGNQGQALH
jgi:hypothetical protein